MSEPDELCHCGRMADGDAVNLGPAARIHCVECLPYRCGDLDPDECPFDLRRDYNEPGGDDDFDVDAPAKAHHDRLTNHDLIAAALAAEREKARAPFLALAAAVKDGWSPSADRLADAIRQVAKGS